MLEAITIVQALLESDGLPNGLPDDLSDEEIRADVDELISKRFPRILISFSRTTPESAEDGDFSETGWIDEEGVEMTPDIDYEDDDPYKETVASKAIAFLKDEGACYASSSDFYPGVWYTTEYQTLDYHTGEEEEKSYHLKGFTEEEEQAIYQGVTSRSRRRGYG